MNRQIWLGFILLISVFGSWPLQANDEPVRQLRAFLTSSRSLSADFKQVLLNEQGLPAKTSYGVFYLQRPGKFRWDYQKPFSQQIVADKGKVWFYDKDLDQVTVKKLDQSLGSTPALLLSGEVSLEDNFIIEGQGKDGDMQWIKLSPKSEETTFKYILIGLTKGSLGGMELSDNFGQLTRIYFSNVLINPPLKQTLFQFEVPKGADVFEE
ncbi:outer membrane lipoprotein chaperone LolA [Candidatus Methylomicrobium oryzae]|jgi:outer membrane lipoprotein carrier protein|uniref:outer membrane lipoprotein chaperone LolA n=1 Tax=Candidatus Methylomicrobium oryzae TaxID=2802053 RepID=UPI001923FEC5|nr:outer membrane lipoprotein chaperone LolA [Methylomicrobium sp. RS1]MBL1263750.1 outer membrane lipoprotein chaperone LolA [Methylomicrobium sp. RS1]